MSKARSVKHTGGGPRIALGESGWIPERAGGAFWLGVWRKR